MTCYLLIMQNRTKTVHVNALISDVFLFLFRLSGINQMICWSSEQIYKTADIKYEMWSEVFVRISVGVQSSQKYLMLYF